VLEARKRWALDIPEGRGACRSPVQSRAAVEVRIMRSLQLAWTVALVIGLTAGCGSRSGYKVVPVSGRVTMDGKPLARAHVNFQPVGDEQNREPGPGSYAVTDEQGHFVLKLADGSNRSGAVVGTHIVKISTVLKGEEFDPKSETGSPDDYVPPTKERIPPEYNENTTLSFDVPPEGTSQANFDLKSRPTRP